MGYGPGCPVRHSWRTVPTLVRKCLALPPTPTPTSGPIQESTDLSEGVPATPVQVQTTPGKGPSTWTLRWDPGTAGRDVQSRGPNDKNSEGDEGCAVRVVHLCGQRGPVYLGLRKVEPFALARKDNTKVNKELQFKDTCFEG